MKSSPYGDILMVR